ncbi:conserved hypothetical protein [Pediculus humanus corporis]|uniref:ZAD domain-containing protein n=1 Tax=Pediculus humanus subsp. corporis TaxID=121224 RepID=E0VIF9_PEDHC|nr:uncharacterized protein Phum_PHUM227230 [Pediculus humanus corporis]EEB13165.1 conserved hypothetical protein [Pediculus humanus corporis]
MGSTAKGLISGFICRLCSKMNRYVILIYSEEGERMGLAEKINLHLPITVTKNDPLPKTVCLNCINRLEKHSQMIQMITRAETKFDIYKEELSNNGSQRCIDGNERNLYENNDSDSDN